MQQTVAKLCITSSCSKFYSIHQLLYWLRTTAEGTQFFSDINWNKAIIIVQASIQVIFGPLLLGDGGNPCSLFG